MRSLQRLAECELSQRLLWADCRYAGSLKERNDLQRAAGLQDPIQSLEYGWYRFQKEEGLAEQAPADLTLSKCCGHTRVDEDHCFSHRS